MDLLKKIQSGVSSAPKQGDSDTLPPLPYPDQQTAKDLGIKLSAGPDFDSLYQPNAPVMNPLQVPPNIKEEINRYIDTKIISPADEEMYQVSPFKKSMLALYRNATQLYFLVDYIINYNSTSYIKSNMKDAPGLAKQLIQQNDIFLLLFLDPSFLSLLVVFFILQTVLQFTILPNLQNFEYSDIPSAVWYIPMYITRFIGNMFYFLFYILILFWAGMRRLVNDNVSIPMTLLYITAILTCLQLIFITFLTAVSGELPKNSIRDSMTAILSYIIPLLMFSFIPNVIQMIPSKSVRKHASVPILPFDPKAKKNSIHYTMDFSIIQCYTKGRFFQNVLLYTVLYLFTTALLYDLDPSLTTFIRGDLVKLKHRKDVKKPAAMFQSFAEKIVNAVLYHASVILTVSISALSITGMPYPYNSSGSAFNHGLFFAFLLPLGKLLVEFKYRYDEMDFYGVFYDVFATFFRIMFPMLLVTKINEVSSILAFLLYFDSSHPLPTWMTYGILLIGILLFTLILRSLIPSRQPTDTGNQPESESQIEKEEKTEKALQSLIQRAKTILLSLQSAEDRLQS